MASTVSSIPSKRYQPTSEQMALSEARKAKRLKNAEAGAPPQQIDMGAGKIIERSWIPISSPKEDQGHDQRIKVFTWNLLAQCLVRRDLFPTSNCLKAGQREHMLYRELLAPQADILCLQEVDRLEKLLPVLKEAGYAHHYAAGPKKQHGCLIAFKEQLYTLQLSKTVLYDDQEVRSGIEENLRLGKSFHTKNIGNLVSLQSKSTENEGVIVATTHLFWHPRQAGILVRETTQFRAELNVEHWPCIVSGDFNFAPDDAAYSLLVGDTLLPEQEQRLLTSHVVHMSVDPTVPRTVKAPKEDGEEAGTDPDKVITSARAATPTDGLLSPSELVDFFARIPRVRSAYDVGLGSVKDLGDLQTYGGRVALGPSRRGKFEPEYTSYTHYWKTVLDYIFVIDPVDRRSNVIAVLAPHKAADLILGLPQSGVSSSDHVSLAAELHWSKVQTSTTEP